MRLPKTVFCALLTTLALMCGLSYAQAPVPVVMLSDLHFDPFHDPAKVPELRQAPIERWPAILSAPPSPTQVADLQSLQQDCHSRALDTSWTLMNETLKAAHDAEARPLFVTLSGDLLAHEFPCRFVRLTAGATPQDVAAFSAKTVAFLMAQLSQTFPHAPVYGSLGNNDSGCNDYRETPNDAFLKSAAATFATAAHLSAANTTPEGDYSVRLPPPMQHTRLIVLEDVFESRQFATCAGTPDRDSEKAQIDWLRSQLTEARAHNEHVWVMSHIPPGIDVYTSFRHYLLQPAGLCEAAPQPFLADTSLADALLDFADVVRLALFGHTHMDEIRVLHRTNPAQDRSSAPDHASSALSSRPERSAVERPPVATASAKGPSLPPTTAAIPAKLVPSVTPYLGNHPAFLVASVEPRTAVLKDWRTFISPGAEGSTPPWTEAYRFTTAYHLPDFSAQSALKLADAFAQDKTGQSAESSTFRQHFYPGDIGIYALGLAQIWPAYACAVREDRPSAVHTCICKTLPTPASQP